MRKMRKNLLKNHFFGVVRRCNGAESRNSQKKHLGLLMNVHSKFQLSSSIWRGNRGETDLFQGQKRENLLISLSNKLGKLIFGYVV